MIKLTLLQDGTVAAVLKNDTHLSRWIAEQGRLDVDPTIAAQIVPLIKPGDTVVDVGACLGDHTVAYAKAVGPTGRVLAFEPCLPAFVCLTVNCRDLPWVELRFNGLNDCYDTVTMIQDPNIGASHVVGGNEPYELAIAQEPWRTECRTLDSVKLDRCDFIKIDVEGYEPNVIAGAMATIKKFRPKMFVELKDGTLARYGFTKTDVLQPLFELGYRIQFIHPDHNLKLEQLDVFLLPG